MKPLKVIATIVLFVPMSLGMGVAYLFGLAIRWINKSDPQEPDEDPENVVRLHQKPEGRLWPLD